MRLLIDMNLSPRGRQAFEEGGFAASHWSEVGAATASDAEIMAYAAERRLVVVTHDLDFGAILAASGGTGPSVVQLRADDTSPEANAGPLLAALRQCASDLDTGALMTVDSRRHRLSLLPLRR